MVAREIGKTLFFVGIFGFVRWNHVDSWNASEMIWFRHCTNTTLLGYEPSKRIVNTRTKLLFRCRISVEIFQKKNFSLDNITSSRVVFTLNINRSSIIPPTNPAIVFLLFRVRPLVYECVRRYIWSENNKREGARLARVSYTVLPLLSCYNKLLMKGNGFTTRYKMKWMQGGRKMELIILLQQLNKIVKEFWYFLIVVLEHKIRVSKICGHRIQFQNTSIPQRGK